MKIKTNVEFIAFDDGICDIYTEDEGSEKIIKYDNLGFSNRVLGFKRFFEASANQIIINRVIRIPQLPGIDNYDYVEIEIDKVKVKYGVKMVQPIPDTNPLSTDLTLDKAR